jgi:hypothetical protein
MPSCMYGTASPFSTFCQRLINLNRVLQNAGALDAASASDIASQQQHSETNGVRTVGFRVVANAAKPASQMLLRLHVDQGMLPALCRTIEQDRASIRVTCVAHGWSCHMLHARTPGTTPSPSSRSCTTSHCHGDQRTSCMPSSWATADQDAATSSMVLAIAPLPSPVLAPVPLV